MKNRQNNISTKTTKRDIITAAVLLIAAAAACLFIKNRRSDVTARVFLDGQTVFEAKLSEINEKTVINPADGIEIIAENGKIGFTSSTCATHECIKSGMLSLPYSTAACIPNRVLITLSPSTRADGELDAIAY